MTKYQWYNIQMVSTYRYIVHQNNWQQSNGSYNNNQRLPIQDEKALEPIPE